MKTEPLRPLETTWEDWLLGDGLRASFADPSLPVEVEIGPGDDGFLLERALEAPDRNWLGIEYSRKRVRRYVRRISDRCGEIDNLRLIWRPAADVVGPFLAPEEVEAYHIYFPDPWPKKHHHRYRMLTSAFIADLRRSLVPGGEVRIRTDHRDYAEDMLAAFAQVPGWTNPIPPPGYRVMSAGDIHTVFETRWREAGRTIFGIDLARTG